MELTLIVRSVLWILPNSYILNDLDLITHVGGPNLRVFVIVNDIILWTLIMQELLALSNEILGWPNVVVLMRVVLVCIVSLQPIDVLIIDSDSWLAGSRLVMADSRLVVAKNWAVVSYTFLIPESFTVRISIIHHQVALLGVKLKIVLILASVVSHPTVVLFGIQVIVNLMVHATSNHWSINHAGIVSEFFVDSIRNIHLAISLKGWIGAVALIIFVGCDSTQAHFFLVVVDLA